MFVRKVSCVDVRMCLPVDGDPIELDRIDGLEDGPDPAVREAAQASYESFLASRDYSSAGDLLPFFVRDFFHDSTFGGLSIDGYDQVVSFEAESWVEIGDDERDVRFLVRFEDVAWFSVEAVVGDYGEYVCAEIDALETRISEAQERFGGSFHSLTVETGGGGWLCLVFRSVSVTARDRIQWLRILREPAAQLDALYMVDRPVA